MVKLLFKLSTEEDRPKFFELTKNAKVCVVCFSAEWCGPCKRLATELNSKMADLLENDGKSLSESVVLLKVDIDTFEDLAKVYEVETIPHTVFYKDGNLLPDVMGSQSDKIVEKVKSLLQ